MDKNFILAAIIIVIGSWGVLYWVWWGAIGRIRAWRETIKKGDRCYMVNQLGERAYVQVIGVDRSKTKPIHIEIEWQGQVSQQWCEERYLFPAPQPKEDK